jgi:hypothetical protein
MTPISENVGTFNLNGEILTITNEMGVRNISVVLVSGSVTVKGSMKLGDRASDAIVLTVGTPLNLTFDFSIDGYVIDAMSGVATLITGK